jgi:ketosteroid isomerase-like protein
LVMTAGLLLCILGGLAMWRAANPPLNDEQLISRQVEELRSAVEKRRAGGITQFLSADATWNGMDSKSLRAAITQALLQWRDVRLAFSDEGVVVRGDEAASAGRYSLTVRETPDAKPETYEGEFGLQWKKSNGRWVITQATGGQHLPGIGSGTDPSL